MDTPIIPWQLFFAELNAQQMNTIELWLRRWWFTNEGVILVEPALGSQQMMHGWLCSHSH